MAATRGVFGSEYVLVVMNQHHQLACTDWVLPWHLAVWHWEGICFLQPQIVVAVLEEYMATHNFQQWCSGIMECA